MTEQEWWKSADLEKMLIHLRGYGSDRKWRLGGCACWRRIERLMDQEGCLVHLAVVERFADGLPDADQLADAAAAIRGMLLDFTRPVLTHQGTSEFAFAAESASQHLFNPARCSANWLTELADGIRVAAYYSGPPGYDAASIRARYAKREAEHRWQVSLLRDLFGPLPFRSLTIPSSWRQWDAGTIIHLARGIYEDRAFDRLPILGDALEDAGCTSEDILTHCRQPGDHVRGCWVLDLLLEKS
jgi:hypothetical protein